LVRAMYLSAFVVAVSTWGTISSARPLPFLNLKLENGFFSTPLSCLMPLLGGTR